jgi:hypothetical protein
LAKWEGSVFLFSIEFYFDLFKSKMKLTVDNEKINKNIFKDKKTFIINANTFLTKFKNNNTYDNKINPGNNILINCFKQI